MLLDIERLMRGYTTCDICHSSISFYFHERNGCFSQGRDYCPACMIRKIRAALSGWSKYCKGKIKHVEQELDTEYNMLNQFLAIAESLIGSDHAPEEKTQD